MNLVNLCVFLLISQHCGLGNRALVWDGGFGVRYRPNSTLFPVFGPTIENLLDNYNVNVLRGDIRIQT